MNIWFSAVPPVVILSMNRTKFCTSIYFVMAQFFHINFFRSHWKYLVHSLENVVRGFCAISVELLRRTRQFYENCLQKYHWYIKKYINEISTIDCKLFLYDVLFFWMNPFLQIWRIWWIQQEFQIIRSGLNKENRMILWILSCFERMNLRHAVFLSSGWVSCNNFTE